MYAISCKNGYPLPEDIERGDSLLALFMSCVQECIGEREHRKFEEGSNSKLVTYKTFGKNVEFKSTYPTQSTIIIVSCKLPLSL